MKELWGFTTRATDGDIGSANDPYFEDDTWTIRYMIVDTRRSWPGKKVLVSPRWIERVSRAESKVHVELNRESIRNAPAYDPARPIDRAFEERLHTCYGRPGYWPS